MGAPFILVYSFHFDVALQCSSFLLQRLDIERQTPNLRSSAKHCTLPACITLSPTPNPEANVLSFGFFIVLLAVALLVAPYRMAHRNPPPTPKENQEPHE